MAKASVGYFSGRFSHKVVARSVYPHLLNVCLMTGLHQGVVVLLARLLELPRPMSRVLVRAGLVELAAGLLLIIPLYRFLLFWFRLEHRLGEGEE